MNPDTFSEVTAAFPEACILLRGVEVLAANAAASRLTGLRRSALLGASLEGLTTEPDQLRQLLRDASATRTMIPGRLRIRRPGGSVADCKAEAATLRPPDANASALLMLRLQERGDQDRFRLLNDKIDELSRQIRARMKLEAERTRLLAAEREARAAAETANRMKDEFLATLSHELRTPLNAIVGWASMLRSGVAADQLDKGLETIHRAAMAQNQLVADLLDVARIITGKLRIELKPIFVAEPVQAAIHAVEPSARAKGIRLQSMVSPDAGPVSGDADRIQQIVWNMLANAIKFTPRGGRVQVRVESVDSHIEIIVSDTGDGIDPSVLPYVFERFRQGQGSLTREHAGLGLGLSIVRHLVEAHGGQVDVYSAGRGTGTTITVMLPLLVYERPPVFGDIAPAGPSDREPPIRLAGVPPDLLAGLRVLVVEDEPDSREMLVRLFTAVGAETVAARTAEQALAEVELSVPDVMVSDIELVGEDGYMLARKLRALPPGAGGAIPAVALTGFSRSSDRVRALAAGFQMHVPKPADPAELIAVVASLVGRRLDVEEHRG